MKLKTKKRMGIETPIADFLLQNKYHLTANFHALPIFHLNPNLKRNRKYRELFGVDYMSLETTITGRAFDSFFYPTRCIKRAQQYAAEAFGARDSLFVTCGTSIANQIVVDAVVNKESRVLLDREAHQSLHFSVNNKTDNYDYFFREEYCKISGRKFINMEKLISQIIEAEKLKTPYDILVISASSYDGVIINISKFIEKIIVFAPKIKFIVDEAWSSAFYFHPELSIYTAGYAAAKFSNKIDIVSTQSAHKSLMALRQASFIHSFANDEITRNLYASRFKFHSTSPNYPILASLDLSRAQMQAVGNKLLTNALANTKKMQTLLNEDPSLSVYKLPSPNQSLSTISNGIFVEDPLKIHIKFAHLGMAGDDLQEQLYYHYGLYFNRFTKDSFLLNIHISIEEEHLHFLVDALKSIKKGRLNKKIEKIKTDFVISYPPGIPLYAPREKITKQVYTRIRKNIQNGSTVFQVK